MAKRSAAKKSSAKRGSQKRQRINTGTDTRYVKRRTDGTFCFAVIGEVHMTARLR